MRAILTDVTKCIGCAKCIEGCKKVNDLPNDYPRQWQKMDGLSATNWTSLVQKDDIYIRKQCRHCVEPACEAVCPVGALEKTSTGAVIYHKDKCLGCRYCMMACPYGIPRYDWDSAVPYVEKCIMCYDNIKNGKIKQPGCTSDCPTGATIYGEREELLKIAKKRIASEPNKYLNHIYGEEEVGGSNVIYLTSKDYPLEFLNYYNHRQGKKDSNYGLPDIRKPIPNTIKTAMQSVPFAFLGMGTIMSGAYWIMKRRQKLATSQSSENNNSKETPEDLKND